VTSVGDCDECRWRWRVSVTSVSGESPWRWGFAVLVRDRSFRNKGLDKLTWSQNGVQQSGDVRKPIGIATSRVAQLRELLFICTADKHKKLR